MSEIDLSFLARVPTFRRLSKGELARVATAMEARSIAAGATLAEMDAPGSDAFVVREGTLRLDITDPEGPPRLIARCGPGTLVGEACLVKPSTRSLTIRAAEASTVYVIVGQRFGVLLAADDPGAHKALRAMAVALCDRLREATAREAERPLGAAPDHREGVAMGVPPAPEDTVWRRLQRMFGRAG